MKLQPEWSCGNRLLPATGEQGSLFHARCLSVRPTCIGDGTLSTNQDSWLGCIGARQSVCQWACLPCRSAWAWHKQSRFAAEFVCNIAHSRNLLDADKPQLTPHRRVPCLRLIPRQTAEAPAVSPTSSYRQQWRAKSPPSSSGASPGQACARRHRCASPAPRTQATPRRRRFSQNSKMILRRP